MVQDSWLTLVAGRLVASSGIPHHELLTVWAHGRTWIDQQWLAQLVFYKTYSFGGVRAVLALSALLSGIAWVLAVVLSRMRGASGLALLFWAPFTIVVAPWAWQARAQTFALPLFVCLLALVFSDSRQRSPRVFLALPLIALWGNLHGTAILGAGILGLHALVTVRRGILRAAALAGGGVLALAANPYGFGIASYYRTMTVDPPFASLVSEWKASTPSLAVAPFYVLALVAVVAIVRKRDELTPTELAVCTALLVVAFDAKRSITWFALAALIVVPPLVHVRRMPGMRFAAPARAGVLLGTVVVVAVGIVAFPGAVSTHQKKNWSTRGAAVAGPRGGTVAAGARDRRRPPRRLRPLAGPAPRRPRDRRHPLRAAHARGAEPARPLRGRHRRRRRAARRSRPEAPAAGAVAVARMEAPVRRPVDEGARTVSSRPVADDWRIRIEVEETHAGGLLDRLGAELDEEARELAQALSQSRLAVSRDGDEIFVYASSRTEAEHAQQVVESQLKSLGGDARASSIEHWLEDEERWDDEPKGETWEEEELDRGFAPWEVRVQSASRAEAKKLEDAARVRGLPARTELQLPHRRHGLEGGRRRARRAPARSGRGRRRGRLGDDSPEPVRHLRRPRG